MFAVKGKLRGTINRKMDIEGESRIDYHKTCVVLDEFTAVSTETGREVKNFKAGKTYVLSSDTKVAVKDGRLVIAKFNSGLYASGVVSAPPVLDPSDGLVRMTATYTPYADIPASEFEVDFVKLYVTA